MATAAAMQVQALMNSHWSTDQLTGFALVWPQTDEAYSHFVWEIIASSEDSAREYCTWLGEIDMDALRQEVAEALVKGGWDLYSIDEAKS